MRVLVEIGFHFKNSSKQMFLRLFWSMILMRFKTCEDMFLKFFPNIVHNYFRLRCYGKLCFTKSSTTIFQVSKSLEKEQKSGVTEQLRFSSNATKCSLCINEIVILLFWQKSHLYSYFVWVCLLIIQKQSYKRIYLETYYKIYPWLPKTKYNPNLFHSEQKYKLKVKRSSVITLVL